MTIIEPIMHFKDMHRIDTMQVVQNSYFASSTHTCTRSLKAELTMTQRHCMLQGSCTACILVLEGNQLHVANLGDSGFLVVRNGKVVYKSEPQQVSFNYPYQLHMPGATRGQLPCHADVSICNHALHAYHIPCAL